MTKNYKKILRIIVKKSWMNEFIFYETHSIVIIFYYFFFLLCWFVVLRGYARNSLRGPYPGYPHLSRNIASFFIWSVLMAAFTTFCTSCIFQLCSEQFIGSTPNCLFHAMPNCTSVYVLHLPFEHVSVAKLVTTVTKRRFVMCQFPWIIADWAKW